MQRREGTSDLFLTTVPSVRHQWVDNDHWPCGARPFERGEAGRQQSGNTATAGAVSAVCLNQPMRTHGLVGRRHQGVAARRW